MEKSSPFRARSSKTPRARDKPTYGINTGFGAFANRKIAPDKLDALQLNLVRSHAAGVGAPLDARLTRRMILLKANGLLTGFSGVLGRWWCRPCSRCSTRTWCR